MTEVDAVEKYTELYERALAVGLNLKTRDGHFEFNIRHAHGLISKKSLAEVEIFIRGYELGIESSLEKEAALLAKIGELELKLSDVVLSKDEPVERGRVHRCRSI